MAAPNVGAVSVEVLADAKSLAKSLRKEVESAFKGLDLGKTLRDSLSNQKIKLPVDLDPDTASIPAKVRGTRVPKVPVQLDPVLTAFQQEVKRQTNALARSVNTNIPIGADTTGLRAQLGAELGVIQRELKAQIPTEPGAKAEYEAKLKALVDAASERVKAHVKVEADSGPNFSALSGIAGKLTPNFLGFSTLVSGVGSAVSGLTEGVQKFAASAAEGGSALAGSISQAAGPVGAIVALLASAATAMGVLSGAATLAVPAFTAAAGAAAAIPAALAGIGAGVGTLALGFKGISEAFNPKTGGGGGGGGAGASAAQQARQVAAASRQVEAARRGIAAANRGLQAAERGLADAELEVGKAQDRSRLAQLAVNQARQDAVEDIDDLDRSLRGAQLSEQEASLAVEDALRALNEVKLTGNIPDIQRADLAYQRALQTLDEAKDTTSDLQKQTSEANKKGVEGSDKVQGALRDQADALDGVRRAHEGVLDAQNGVLSAQDGLKSATDGLKSAQDSLASSQQKVAAGAAAAAAKLIPLAGNARKFVDALKALKPAFEDLRLEVQQHLFAGLDKTVTDMWKAWKYQLTVTLGSFADTFNGFFRNLGSAVSTPKFIGDLAAGAEGARQGFQKIGTSITSSLVPAFGALSRAAGPFLSQLGKEIADVVTDFSNWVLQGEKTGGLKSFFDRAAKALHEIFTTGKLVGAIIGDLFSIITGAQAKDGKTPLDSFNTALKKIDDYLKDPQHQQQISQFVHDVADGLEKFGEAAGKVNGFLDNIGLGSKDKSSSVGADIGKALVDGLVAGVGAAMKASLESFLMWFTPFGPLIQPIKNLLGIQSPSTVMAGIGHDLIAGLVKGVGDWFANLSAKVGQIFGVVTKPLAGAGSWLVTHGRNAIVGLANGIGSAFGTLGSFAGQARVYVQNALVNAGSWLYQHGRAVISGLMQGISSMFNSLGSFLGQVGTFIQQHKGPIDKDRLLLVGAGRAIMGGLITGIGDRKDALASELADVTSIVAGTQLPGFGVAADAALSATLQASSQQQLQVAWKSGATVEPVLRAFQDLIDVKFRGDVQAAFSRG